MGLKATEDANSRIGRQLRIDVADSREKVRVNGLSGIRIQESLCEAAEN